ncbi:MerR family transcriptional regulator [Corynebacterium canis]|uniref:MerR family transcriptional regulator n=1 Tax=Corynebacterium canis TaxID=679663 RepID=A0A5C5UL89_9CORY|nr:MerR family transcriptional regulator [Corynebacterium canis]TWT26577.1 MerR family transcriptional regulator [Corynebacterium canis]WJY76355.1 Putative heat shock protein HspR [Corynebacterium canis]
MNREQTETEFFVISVAAELAGMHAQTLRAYDRLGLVTPMRSRGGGRRYSRHDVDLLREIHRLSQEEGVNLAGIKTIIALDRENDRLRRENDRLRAQNEALQTENERLQTQQPRPRGEIVHVPRSTAVVMWEPRQRKR